MISGITHTTKLIDEAPLGPLSTVAHWGTTLIVAPHPDDESLGCGGAIAALRLHHIPVHALFISDGSMSHPQSIKYSSEDRTYLREQEAVAALFHLGVEPERATFLRLPDTKVPTAHTEGFEEQVMRICDYLLEIQPQTILVPWRRDPHCDHQATWQLCHRAVQMSRVPVQWREYPIWIWEFAEEDDLPHPEEGKLWRLDIRETLAQKKAAIAAHLSQTTFLIDDDPQGFILTQGVLEHFTKPYEIYFDPS